MFTHIFKKVLKILSNIRTLRPAKEFNIIILDFILKIEQKTYSEIKYTAKNIKVKIYSFITTPHILFKEYEVNVFNMKKRSVLNTERNH